MTQFFRPLDAEGGEHMSCTCNADQHDQAALIVHAV